MPQIMGEPQLVVVTGAGGFVGRALVAHFDKTGRPSRPIARHEIPSSGSNSLIAQRRGDAPSRIRLPVAAPRTDKSHASAVADLADAPDDVLEALVSGATSVVHLAGRAHVLRETSADPVAAYTKANVTMTARLARAAVGAGVRRFVFASTIKVNGEASLPSRPFRPDDPPDPRDDYARSKLAAERELASIAAGTCMSVIVLRLPLVYGPGVKGNFLTMLDELARERTLPLASIRNRRSLLFVGNLVDAIDAALDAPVPPAGTHFVADAEAVSVPELAMAAGVALGVSVRLKAVPVSLLAIGGRLTGKRAMVERLVGTLEADTSSYAHAAGWRPRYRLAEGLAETAAWWRMRHSI